MSSPNSNDLLKDRIKFKFHAAKEHLKNLKTLESEGGINKNPNTKVRSEIEIEDLLAHLIGVIDVLLARINKKLNLGITEDKVCLTTVKKKLERLDLIKDLIDLDDDKCSWYWKLKEFRNIGTHRKIINVNVSVSLFENANTVKGSSAPTRIYFKDSDTDLELISYLEDRIQKMEDLIQTIINKEPLLETP
jgi:Cthe_2314-like HEPN